MKRVKLYASNTDNTKILANTVFITLNELNLRCMKGKKENGN